MTGVYIHLLLNHFPPIVNIVALLLFFLSLIWKSESVFRASLIVMVFAALVGIPTFLTGDAAADAVKGMPGVVQSAVDPHDQSANVSVTLICIEGAAALAALVIWRGERTVPHWFVWTILVLALVATGAVTYTAHLGGLIHHPEAKLKL